ncbi:condensation domain-containing protein [Saccharothrix sp.]|uniref:condensation domain-containing protein n=1 Tax=Saccharothrix sp. TaxID=1873460 RepID=UPI0028126146|nr:condensation domain-containing protein [Saccharothrix sp.]
MSEARATAAQEALWWVHQRAVRKSVYHITWRMGCASPPDLAALRTAWQAVVNRHDALRMALTSEDGKVQAVVTDEVIAPARSVSVDTSAPPSPLLARIAEEIHDEPMPLDSPPLARLVHVRVGDEHELLLTAHHSIVDGWAIRLVLDDLSTAYEAAGEQPTFPDAPSFAQYAADQHAAGEKGKWQKSIEYWQKALDGASAVTVAPDRPVRAKPGGSGTTLRYEISPEAVQGLAIHAKTAGTTSFAVVLGALQAVLARGGAGGDVTVATPAANRMTAREQKLVGYLTNLVVARAHITDDDTIEDITGRARDSLWQLLSHQSTPYPKVFADLPEPTKAALGDIPPVVLTYLGPLSSGLQLGDIPLTLHRSPNRAARADFTIGYWDSDDGVVVEVEYSEDRYDRSTTLRLLHDLDTVLATPPDHPIRSLPLRTMTVEANVPEPKPTGAGTTAATAARAAAAGTAAAGTAGAGTAAAGTAGTGTAGTGTAAAGTAGAEIVGGSWDNGSGGRRPHPPTDQPLDPSLDPAVDPVIDPAVARAWEQVLGHPPTDPDQDFFAAGGSSLTVLHLASAIEAATGTRLDLVTWLADPTPRRIDHNPTTPTPTTLVVLRDAPGPHLHLIHGAGGSPQDFRDLVDALPDWKITASQDRTTHTTVPDLAAAYQKDLAETPDVIAGWSFGGLVAHELAHQDTALLLIDTPPPTGHPDEPTPQDFAAMVTDHPAPNSDDDTLAVRALAACLVVTGEEIPAWALVERWHAYRRHARAGAAHVSTKKIHTAAALIAADITDDDIDHWRTRLPDNAKVLRVDTDHWGVIKAPAAQQVADAVRSLVHRETA